MENTITMDEKQQLIEDYLKENGVSKEKIYQIISGFDLSRPVYQQRIWASDRLFQYVVNPSSSQYVSNPKSDPEYVRNLYQNSFRNSIKTGNWFALKGATMDSLGIFSGGSGRSLTEFKVKISIVALEGTAKKMERDWSWAGGGTGGGTQIFIPYNLFYALEALGTHLS